MRKKIVLTILLGFFAVNTSYGQKGYALELSANFSSFFNDTYGLQAKVTRDIRLSPNFTLFAGIASSFHYADVLDTEDTNEVFSGNHTYLHALGVVGKEFGFGTKRWKLSVAMTGGYSWLWSNGKLESATYNFTQTYRDQFNEFSFGFQVIPSFRVSETLHVFINTNAFFTDMPDFGGIGVRMQF